MREPRTPPGLSLSFRRARSAGDTRKKSAVSPQSKPVIHTPNPEIFAHPAVLIAPDRQNVRVAHVLCYSRPVVLRCRVERFEGLDDDWNEVGVYRVVEGDTGQPVDCWLPGIENPDCYGALDRGGFDQRQDARGFALGVDRERALHGLLPGLTVADIDAERRKLDGAHWQKRRRPIRPPDVQAYRAEPEAV